jgi:hypothetical protein
MLPVRSMRVGSMFFFIKGKFCGFSAVKWILKCMQADVFRDMPDGV